MARFKMGNFNNKRKKANMSPMDILRRKLLRLRIWAFSVIGVLVLGLAILIYGNYDYFLFKILVGGNYLHTETLDEMFMEHIGFVPHRHTSHFDNLVIAIMTREIRDAGGDVYTFMYTPTQRQAFEQRVQERATRAQISEVAPGVGHLVLYNISPYVQDFVQNNRYDINAFDSLIIDLRYNNGGELSAMQAIASLFLERGATINYENARMGWPFSRERRSRGSQYFEFEQIIILQNDRTASAAETLIAALSYNLDNVTTIGTQTFGKAVGQALLPLRRGFAVNATVIELQTPEGNSINNVGIAPDVFFEGDDALELAISKLGN